MQSRPRLELLFSGLPIILSLIHIFLRQFGDGDYVVLLDERGDEYRSIDFAYWLQKRMASGIRRLVMAVSYTHLYGFQGTISRSVSHSPSASMQITGREGSTDLSH